MFRQLGLRHLAVLGMDGCLAGILTRKDLILAEDGQKEMAKATKKRFKQLLENEMFGAGAFPKKVKKYIKSLCLSKLFF